MLDEGEKNQSLSKSKPTNKVAVLLAALLSFPAAAILVIAIYQSARTLYCSCFNNYKNSITQLWCNYISYDFRPDFMLIIFFVCLIYPAYFVLKNKDKSINLIGRRLLFWLSLGLLGFLANSMLNIFFNNESWW